MIIIIMFRKVTKFKYILDNCRKYQCNEIKHPMPNAILIPITHHLHCMHAQTSTFTKILFILWYLLQLHNQSNIYFFTFAIYILKRNQSSISCICNLYIKRFLWLYIQIPNSMNAYPWDQWYEKNKIIYIYIDNMI